MVRDEPSLGYQLLESALLKDSKSMTREKFAMEHLVVPRDRWQGEKPISAAAWAKAATAAPPQDA